MSEQCHFSVTCMIQICNDLQMTNIKARGCYTFVKGYSGVVKAAFQNGSVFAFANAVLENILHFTLKFWNRTFST